MSKVLVLRPPPGAEATAARARALGLDPVVAPLFSIRPLAWTMPAGAFDAVMLTSANAARHGGLTSCVALPCYAVGEATAAAARAAGFAAVRTGPADGMALAAMMAGAGVRAALHPCGADHVPLAAPGLEIVDLPVYAADPVAALPGEAQAALADGALALLHSPRAAALFARLAAPWAARTRIAAISPAALAAAGPGWAEATAAPRPRDEALLELAAKLCQTADMRARRA
jgi:uroporphyrinogen-III synthase